MSLTKINEKIDAALEAYRDASAKEASPKELRKLNAKVKALHAERSGIITDGAVDCSTCGSPAIGMKRRPGVYEIGCSVCMDRRAQGEDPEAAVKGWNELNK